MEPYQFGGEMIRTVGYEDSTFNTIPHKFEAGTPNIAGAIGLGAAIDFVKQVGLANIHQHMDELLQYGTEKLKGIDGLRLIGTARQKTSIISFLLGGH